MLQLCTPTGFLVIHLKERKTTEKVEVWLIIVYYNIVLVLVLMILKKLINKNNHRFYLLICLSVKNINMHPVKNHN